MFKLNHYYKGTNPDGTYIIYKVVTVSDKSSWIIMDIKVIVDHDKDTVRRIDKNTVVNIEIDMDSISPSKENKWLINAEEITNKSKLLAYVL